MFLPSKSYHLQNHFEIRESYVSYLNFNRNRWVDNRPPSGANKGTRGGMVFGFSACRDNQLAADTSVLFFQSFDCFF